MPECKICLGPHDDEIHAATLRVRAWFRSQVLISITTAGPAEPVEIPSQEQPTAA